MTFRGVPNWIPPPTPAQPGGLALGVNVFSALGDAGVFQTAVQWVYSPGISRDEFPPHRELAGEFFDYLPTSDGYYPGDHKGCLCHDEPILRSKDGRFVARTVLNPPNSLANR